MIRHGKPEVWLVSDDEERARPRATGLQPTFYTVEKVTEHTLPEAAP